MRQAERYMESMDDCFSMLGRHPKMGRLAKPIGLNVRRHEHGSHVILYVEEPGGVLILAVIHGRSVHGLKL